jgi:hypothetical protein
MAAIAAPAAAQADTLTAAENAQPSSNWAGYTASGQSFSKVSGTWTQPAASCESGSGDAAFWVGIGGASQGSNALEQAGTEVNCDSGTPTYSAWYELVPAAPVPIDLAVNPGDKISTTVGVQDSSVSIRLTNDTTGKSFSKTLHMDNPDTSSAEWIAEAPSACQGGTSGQCQTVPLADFSSVGFTNATATADGHTGSIGDSDWQATPMQLQPGASGQWSGGQFGGGLDSAGDATSTASAIPSTLTGDGKGFTVAWQSSSDDQGTSTPDPQQQQDPGYGSDPYGDGGWDSQGAWPSDGGGYGSGYGDGWGGDAGSAWGW